MNRHAVEHTNMKARARRMRAGARSLSSKALSIVMSAILVVGLSPLMKASAAIAGEGGSDQLSTGTYWNNGDVSFIAIDSSNGFTSSAWNAYRDTGKDGSGNALGIAGSFHLVAFDTLTSSSHIYGNILANHVYGLQDFGIKSDFYQIYGHSTLSYIQDYQSTCPRFADQSYSNQAIVFGGNTSSFNLFAKNTNGNQVINYANKNTSGTEVQFPRTVAQDLDTANAPFIDMNAVKAETSQLSNSLAAHETAGATYDFADQNSKSITYTQGKGCAYLTLPLSDLTSNGNPIYIKGLPLDGSAALVINVDCKGADAPIPDQVWLKTGDGQNAGLGENDADTGYVLWNFTNANGKTVSAKGMVSSILAPGATINLTGNSCGTFIGENINVSGETHTRPFHGKFDDSKPATTSVSVNKTWLDSKGNAETSVSHDGVQVQLYANGKASGDPVTLSADNSWSHKWANLPVNDESGNAIDYTVKELTQVAGYDSTVTGSAAAGFTIVNQHKPEVEISIAKVWDDNDNIDQVRPSAVTARVMRSVEGGASEQVDSITLNADNQWKASVKGLPTTDANGNQYTYTVVEDAVSGYKGTVESSSSKDANGNVSYAFTLKNSHAPSVVNLSVAKAWQDVDDQDGVRPGQVSVDVLRSEGGSAAKTIVATLKLSAENNWTATLDKQPVYGKSGKYTYSISEAKVDGYTGSVETAVDESGNYVFTLTNTHAVETTQVGVTKVWDDADNADGLRPGSVEVELFADGAATGKTVTLDAANNWTFTWDNLAKKAGGKDITYTVREANVPEGYTPLVTGGLAKENGTFSYALANKHVQAKTSVSVSKEWADGDDQDGLRPDSVQVQLYRSVDGGEAVAMSSYEIALNADSGWKGSWTNLPANEGGKQIAYTVKEADVPAGYTCAISENAGESGAFSYKLTNTHEAGKTSVKVAKAWDDSNDQDGLRPASVKVQLYADGVSVGDPVELSAANEWSHEWAGLDAKKGGNAVKYTVAEVDVPAGYTCEVSENAGEKGTFSYTLTNKHETESTAVNVKKVWDDADNADGMRPASVKVQLYADGVATGQPVELSAANEWKHAWGDLPKLANGKAIEYTVAEVDAPEGYTSVVTGNASFGFTITNSHAVKTTAIGVKKVWNDGNDQDGLRPAEVTAQLLANGQVVAEAKLSAQNAWAHQWTDLPTIADGKAIEYTVAEADVPEGYTSSLMGSAAEGFTLVNAHTTATTSVSVHKEWKDSAGNPQSGVHPAVTAQLYRTVAGQTSAMAGYTATLDEAHGWTASWDNLPAKDAGRDVEYSVQEVDVPAGYTSSVTKAADGSYSFTLTNTAEKRTSVSVAKVWADGGNADNMRPDSVTAQLYLVDAQGNQVAVPGKSVELSQANNWAFTWNDLAVSDADGNEISYTVQEANVPEGYTATVSGGMVDGVYSFTLTNAHELKTVDINVSKVWSDEDDIDGLRPASVTAQLCYVNADGQTVPVEGAEDKVLDESNGWAAGWTGLTANADGKAIKYTVREAEVPEGYTSAVSGIDNGDGTYSFTMVNTHEIEEAEFALSGYSVRSISAPAPEADKVCYVDPKITKEMVGRALQSGEFTFQLIDDQTGAVIATASNGAYADEEVGSIDFDRAAVDQGTGVVGPDMQPCAIVKTSPGFYSFTVREVFAGDEGAGSAASKDPTVEYSTEVIKFFVSIGPDMKVTEQYYVKYASAQDATNGVAGTKYDAMGDSVAHPTITNHVKPIQLGLTKVDAADAGKPLAGAVYGLYRASDSGDVLVAKATSDKDGHMTFLTGAGSAEVISEGVDYWFAEISAPQGYALSDTPMQHFHIDRVGKGAESKYQLVYADGSKGELYDAGTVIEFGDGAKPVTDKALEMTVAKVNSARTGLAGAKLGVRLADGTDPIKEWVSTGAGQVLTGLKANTAYVLYEAEAPEGFAKAGDVTFMLDERGAVQLVDGAWGENILNSYASGSQLTLVDYTNKEIAEKKQVQREEGKTAGKTAGKLSQTGDQLPVAPLAAVAAIALAAAAIAGIAAAKRRKR